MKKIVVIFAVGCARSPAPVAPPPPPTYLFSLGTTSSPCVKTCPHSSTLLGTDGHLVTSSSNGPPREGTFDPAALDEVRRELRARVAAFVPPTQPAPPIEDLRVSCAVWIDGTMHAIEDHQVCFAIETRLWALAKSK